MLSEVQEWHKNMLGFSFTTPTTALDGTTPFTMPPLRGQTDPTKESPFMWQAPSSDAMLFMGEKWVEFHAFVSRMLEVQSASSTVPDVLSDKQVNKKYPSWLEYALLFSRLRGYFTVYPGQSIDTAVLGVHSDLNSDPEEYQGQVEVEEGKEGAPDQASLVFDPRSTTDLLANLAYNGLLPTIREMSLVSWDGTLKSWSDFGEEAEKYADDFRRQVGKCPPGSRQLFC